MTGSLGSDMQTTDVADLTLFIDLARWAAPHLSVPTYHGFIGWLGRWLEQDGIEALERLVPVDHPRQLAAENAVIAWLKKPPSMREVRARRSDTIERSVDWVDTWVRSEGPIPYPYTLRGREEVEPKRLVAALRGLASGWAGILRMFPDHKGRAERARALAEVAQAGPFRGYTVAEDRLLRSPRLASSPLANAIRDAFTIMRLNIARDAEQEQKNLERACLELHKELAAKNLNDLLEVSVRLAIARAALSARPEDLVETGVRWEMAPLAPAGEKEKKPVILLRAGELECVITKGQPERSGMKVTDTLNSAGEMLGLEIRGNQPDVVLTFSRAGSRESITALPAHVEPMLRR